MSKLPLENPPAESPPLREYLYRTISLINGAFSTVFNMEPLGSVPSKVSEGMMRYFSEPVLPDIEYPGPWIYTDGKWNFMSTPVATEVLRSSSHVDQEPVALDIPIQVSFGAATSNEFVSLDALGTLTILKGGAYNLIATLHIGREGSSGGVSEVFASPFVNGVISGDPLGVKVDSPSMVFSIQYSISGSFVAGTTVDLRMYRDSFGVNEGGIYSDVSSIGWGAVPSALLTVERRL